MVNMIQAIIKVLVSKGANHECGTISKTVKIIKSKLGISESRNVFLRSFLPPCPKTLPISYPSIAQKNIYKNAIKTGIEVK